jgi:hypothetical protein
MLESLKEAIDNAMTDPTSSTIDWVHSSAEIVEGVEVILEVAAAAETGAISTAIAGFLEDTAAGVALPVAGAAAGVIAEFAAIGAGYAEAARKIKEDRSSVGFSEGVVMGAMKEKPDFLKSHFFEWDPEQNDFWPEGGKLAQHYFNGALLLGYRYGYDLNKEETGLFLKDLARGLSEPLGDPDAASTPEERERQWVDFYIAGGAQFSKLHIESQGD